MSKQELVNFMAAESTDLSKKDAEAALSVLLMVSNHL